jgi:carbamoyl-phosphate synthase large subunit
MQHVEQAGIHSGDSACMVPPILEPEALKTIVSYVGTIGRELGIIGLVNVQMAIKDGEVYVLEVNPRGSRTVPFISKVIGIPLAKVATKVMLGRKLRELELPKSVELLHSCVKESVFPFLKLPGADPVLGPEMKSTGEVMGTGEDLGSAYFKAEAAAGNRLPSFGCVFMSVRKSEQEKIVAVAKSFHSLGFKILATDGTAETIRRAGIPCEVVLKISQGRKNILDYIKLGEVGLIVNIPTRGQDPSRDGYKIRRAAVEFGIPYITTLAGAFASVGAIKRGGGGEVNPLNVLHARLRKIR